MTDNNSPDDSRYSRRSILAAAAGAAAAGAAGMYGATETVSAAPSGTFPVSSDPALLKLRADRLRLVGRSTDPSSPDNGTLWYRSDL